LLTAKLKNEPQNRLSLSQTASKIYIALDAKPMPHKIIQNKVLTQISNKLAEAKLWQ